VVGTVAALSAADPKQLKWLHPIEAQLVKLQEDVRNYTRAGLDEHALKMVLQEQVKEILDSSATQSIIANAAARGLGSMIGSMITTAIFKSITTPFEVGSEAAAGLRDLMSSVHDFQQTVQGLTEMVGNIREEATASAKAIDDIKALVVGETQKQEDFDDTEKMSLN